MDFVIDLKTMTQFTVTTVTKEADRRKINPMRLYLHMHDASVCNGIKRPSSER